MRIWVCWLYSTSVTAQPSLPGTGGAAGPVEVVLDVLGRLVVDDRTDVVDVDATGRDVGGDEDRQLALGELAQHTLAGALLHVAVQRRGVDAEVGEVGRDPVAHPLGLAEHQHLRDALGDRTDDLVLVHVVHGEEQVVHRADRVGRLVDRDRLRIGLVVTDQVADVAVERRREQHRLVAAGAMAQDPLDLRREAVVGHAVGLVERDDLAFAEFDTSPDFTRSMRRSGVAMTISTPLASSST